MIQERKASLRRRLGTALVVGTLLVPGVAATLGAKGEGSGNSPVQGPLQSGQPGYGQKDRGGGHGKPLGGLTHPTYIPVAPAQGLSRSKSQG